MSTLNLQMSSTMTTDLARNSTFRPDTCTLHCNIATTLLWCIPDGRNPNHRLRLCCTLVCQCLDCSCMLSLYQCKQSARQAWRAALLETAFYDLIVEYRWAYVTMGRLSYELDMMDILLYIQTAKWSRRIQSSWNLRTSTLSIARLHFTDNKL